jgi:hypothetical protein
LGKVFAFTLPILSVRPGKRVVRWVVGHKAFFAIATRAILEKEPAWLLLGTFATAFAPFALALLLGRT